MDAEKIRAYIKKPLKLNAAPFKETPVRVAYGSSLPCDECGGWAAHLLMIMGKEMGEACARLAWKGEDETVTDPPVNL